MTVQDPQGETTYLLGYDQVGSLKAAAAMDGEHEGRVVKVMDYDAFGNVLADSNPGLFLPLAFAGGLRDRFTGLVRFLHRDYDPTVGRFTAPDPLGDTGGDHDLYDYCVDEPVGRVDPEGLKEEGAGAQASRESSGEPSNSGGVPNSDNSRWGVKGSVTSGFINVPVFAWDSKEGVYPKGWFDPSLTTTPVGAGVSITGQASFGSDSPKDDVTIGVGGKNSGIEVNTEGSRGAVNIGSSISLPVTASVSLEHGVVNGAEWLEKGTKAIAAPLESGTKSLAGGIKNSFDMLGIGKNSQ